MRASRASCSQIEPTTEWSLETGAGRATHPLSRPRPRLRHPRGLRPHPAQPHPRGGRRSGGAGGSEIAVELGCDCRVSASFVGARWLALDVADGDAAAGAGRGSAAPDAPETPEERARREADAVASAEQVLIRQIVRAADQGIIEMSSPRHGPAAPAPAAPRRRRRRRSRGPPAAAPIPPRARARQAELRDRARGAAFGRPDRGDHGVRPRQPRRALAAQAARRAAAGLPAGREARRRLLVERPASARAASAARGASSSASSTCPTPKALARPGAALHPLRLRGGGRVAARGLRRRPRARGPRAPRRHGADRRRAAGVARRAAGRRGGLPRPARALAGARRGGAGLARRRELRLGAGAPSRRCRPTCGVLLGPGFAARLIDAGHPAEARVIHDTTVRPGERAGRGARSSSGRGSRRSTGHPLEAAQRMAALVERDGGASVEALTALVRGSRSTRGMPIPEKTVTDLRAAALQYRGAAREPALRGLLAEALARRAELAAAVAEARAAAADLPGQAAAFDALAVRLMAEADPAAVGPAAYAGTVLDAADLIGAVPRPTIRRGPRSRGSSWRSGCRIRRSAMIAPTLADGAAPARLVAAEARIRKGEGGDGARGARAARGPRVGDGAGAGLRARRRLRRRAGGAGARRRGTGRGLRLAVGRLGGGAGGDRGRRRARGDGGLDGGAGRRRRGAGGGPGDAHPRRRPSGSRCRRSTARASAPPASFSRPGRRSAASCKACWPASDAVWTRGLSTRDIDGPSHCNC